MQEALGPISPHSVPSARPEGPVLQSPARPQRLLPLSAGLPSPMPARIFPFFSHPAFGLLAGSPCRKGVSAGIAAACAQREQRGVGEVSPSTDNSSGAAQGPPQAPSSPLSPSLARSKQPNPLPPRWPRVTPAARGFPRSAGGHAQSHQHLPIPLCPPPRAPTPGMSSSSGPRKAGGRWAGIISHACSWHRVLGTSQRRAGRPRLGGSTLPSHSSSPCSSDPAFSSREGTLLEAAPGSQMFGKEKKKKAGKKS